MLLHDKRYHVTHSIELINIVKPLTMRFPAMYER